MRPVIRSLILRPFSPCVSVWPCTVDRDQVHKPMSSNRHCYSPWNTQLSTSFLCQRQRGVCLSSRFPGLCWSSAETLAPYNQHHSWTTLRTYIYSIANIMECWLCTTPVSNVYMHYFISSSQQCCKWVLLFPSFYVLGNRAVKKVLAGI